MAAADRDRAGGDEDHLLAARAAARDVVDQRVEPGAADLAARVVDQQRRADLDDEPPAPRRARLGSWRPGAVALRGLGRRRAASASRVACDRRRRQRASSSLAARPAPVTPDSAQHRRALRGGACSVGALRRRARPRVDRVDLVERRRSRACRRGRGHRPSSSPRMVRQAPTTSSSVPSIRCRITAQRSTWPRKRSPSPAPSLAPSISPGRSASTNSLVMRPRTTPSCGCRVVNGIVGDLRPGARHARRGRSICRHWAGRPARHRRSASGAARPSAPRPASPGSARRGALVGRALEMRVAEAAIAAAQQHDALARLGQVERARSRCPRRGSGADRHAQHEVVAVGAGAVARPCRDGRSAARKCCW